VSQYQINATSNFLKDVEEISFWIFVTNVEQSENLAEAKLSQLESDLIVLKKKIQNFPESGEEVATRGVRKIPIYDGRYSARWIVDHDKKTVTLISLLDSRYPKQLRNIQTEE
jgi:predicted Rossmann fold nucleotide-binding protein DprA/Smf involved in DNA uptake